MNYKLAKHLKAGQVVTCKWTKYPIVIKSIELVEDGSDYVGKVVIIYGKSEGCIRGLDWSITPPKGIVADSAWHHREVM